MTDLDVPGVVEDALVEYFGRRPARASMSLLGVETIEVLRFETLGGEFAYVSLGMARHAMTASDEPALGRDGPRAELMLQLDDHDGRFGDVWRSVALLAAAPEVEGVVYADGMSVDLGQPLASGSRCTGGVVTVAPFGPICTAGTDVTVLQLLPASSAELAWSRVHGTPALREKWSAARVDLSDLARASVWLG